MIYHLIGHYADDPHVGKALGGAIAALHVLDNLVDGRLDGPKPNLAEWDARRRRGS